MKFLMIYSICKYHMQTCQYAGLKGFVKNNWSLIKLVMSNDLSFSTYTIIWSLIMCSIKSLGVNLASDSSLIGLMLLSLAGKQNGECFTVILHHITT